MDLFAGIADIGKRVADIGANFGKDMVLKQIKTEFE